MKIIFRSAILAALLTASSCSKEDTTAKNEQAEEQAEQLEKTPLEANTVSDNVLIKGGTKEAGVPPAPNAAISLNIANSGKTAFLNEGFEVSLNSDAAIIGAFLRFKDADGTVADSYYDIDLAANSSSAKRFDFSGAKKKGSILSTAKMSNASLDVDFTASISPGTFCYEICVYDASGNISAPQEVCAIVESWGGNAGLIGSWGMTKVEETIEGETTVEVLGEPSCETSSVRCNNQDTFEYQECFTTELGNITFKDDGSFTTDFRGIDTEVDYNASAEQCQEVPKENNRFSEMFKGFWAFNTTTSKLTLIAYELTSLEGEGTNTEIEIFENGEGELLFDGVIQLTASTFIITQADDDDLDGTIDYEYVTYFEKN